MRRYTGILCAQPFHRRRAQDSREGDRSRSGRETRADASGLAQRVPSSWVHAGEPQGDVGDLKVGLEECQNVSRACSFEDRQTTSSETDGSPAAGAARGVTRALERVMRGVPRASARGRVAPSHIDMAPRPHRESVGGKKL